MSCPLDCQHVTQKNLKLSDIIPAILGAQKRLIEANQNTSYSISSHGDKNVFGQNLFEQKFLVPKCLKLDDIYVLSHQESMRD